MRKSGHEELIRRLRAEAPAALTFLDQQNIPVEELVAALRSIQRSMHSLRQREAETKELLSLLGNRKRLLRLSQAVEGRGPKNKTLSALIAARFGLSKDRIVDIAGDIPRLHVAGLRRPRQISSF